MDRLQAMTTFVRVVDNGAFSGAARQLGVGQPAVSKTVAQLEDCLQVSLLVRSTHGLTPTEAGQRFYERARRAIEEADEAELEARGAIASDWMFAPELASGEVRRFLEPWALPQIDLWAHFPNGRLASAKARQFAAFVESTLSRRA